MPNSPPRRGAASDRASSRKAHPLTVAVTGPTGTFGFGLMPLLQAERRVGRVIGIARRPFDPTQSGWDKLDYRQGDVRDQAALQAAFEGSDVVVHLAFMITGAARAKTIRAINVEGTMNAFRAARDAGAKRFVYASSVAAYGFHSDNPIGISEDWPTRPAQRLFYAQEKAELEQLLRDEADQAKQPALYLLRPPVVLGPHAAGAKDLLPKPLASGGRALLAAMRGMPMALPMLTPEVQMQFIHEDDVGQALIRCVLGGGPAGAYNIAGDGVLSGSDLARELGFTPVPIPGRVVHALARAAGALPRPGFIPPAADWIEALSHPAIMDTQKAREELGWKPRYSGLEALRATLTSVDRAS